MKTLRGRDSWPLLRISDALLDGLRAKHASGMTAQDMIAWLAEQGVTKPGATIALRLTGVMAVGETKLAVHLHPAYAYRRESDEAFEEAAVAAVEQMPHSEAA